MEIEELNPRKNCDTILKIFEKSNTVQPVREA